MTEYLAEHRLEDEPPTAARVIVRDRIRRDMALQADINGVFFPPLAPDIDYPDGRHDVLRGQMVLNEPTCARSKLLIHVAARRMYRKRADLLCTLANAVLDSGEGAPGGSNGGAGKLRWPLVR